MLILEQCLYGDMNYMIMGLERDIRGYCGEINAHGEMWHPSLGIGSLRWFGHSQHRCVRSASMLCSGMELQSFVCK